MSNFLTVSMDGGAATGKSSSSKQLANKYNWLHVDTGSHYRTVTRALIDQGINSESLSEETLTKSLSELSQTTEIKDDRYAILVLNGRYYKSEEIRNEAVNAVVSNFAAQPKVRSFLLDYQRSLVQLAKEKGFCGLVMEGRDIGSVVLPDADCRFFLHADLEARKKRRAQEGIADEVEKRDKLDSSRKVAPLVCPDGATSIDSGIHNLEEVISILTKYIEEKLT